MQVHKMLSADEAWKIIFRRNVLYKCRACLDFGTFYVFMIAPISIRDDEEYDTGTTFDAVEKATGKHFLYNITDDLEAYNSAKRVSVKQIWDKRLSEVSG